MTRRLIAVSALVALTVSGCSNSVAGTGSRATTTSTSQQQLATTTGAAPSATSSQAAASATDIDPCSLVTKAEADAVAGVSVMPPMRSNGLCTFATPTTGTVGQLEVYVGDRAKKYYDIDKTDLGHEFRDIAGLGDEAHAEDSAIFVRSGSVWFALRVTRLDETDTGPLLESLARTVVGRL